MKAGARHSISCLRDWRGLDCFLGRRKLSLLGIHGHRTGNAVSIVYRTNFTDKSFYRPLDSVVFFFLLTYSRQVDDPILYRVVVVASMELCNDRSDTNTLRYRKKTEEIKGIVWRRWERKVA